jgi:hypothetical protein
MTEKLKNLIYQSTSATGILQTESIQKLWSGYGEILRVYLQGSEYSTVIVKDVRLPKADRHPRGWNTDISHNRKLHSYQVETAWYENWSSLCTAGCRVPKVLTVDNPGDEVVLILEDLDASGFSARNLGTELPICLDWLANFHARFMGSEPAGLWPVGTYWHLETRPDELEVLTDIRLKEAAEEIDRRLSNAEYRTIVHGDAKLANFCFSPDGRAVAAVDFQYVGGGCGMKDLAYFVGSVLSEEECESMEGEILDYYFHSLRTALKTLGTRINFNVLESEWRELYPYAWTDFHRFLKGWSPGHWKINGYSERLAAAVLDEVEAGR